MKLRALIHTLQAAALVTALVATLGTAYAQQAAAPAAAPPAAAVPPTWAQGRTAAQEALNLVPHPPAVTAKAVADIPVSSLKAPDGFKVELWASGLANSRSMTMSPSGVLYVGTRFPGNVYAVVEKDGKREVKTIAKGMHRSNGVAFANGSLYVAELSRILRYDNIEANLDNPPKPVVVFDALPTDEPHGWKYMKLSPDGQYLYFQIGAPANAIFQPVTHATIVRLNIKTNILETFAHGVRNSVGMDFHPQTKELWFTNNARDWIDDSLPEDTLHHAPKKGMNFGYPFCYHGDFLDPEFGKGRSCKDYAGAAAKMGPHTAVLGMRFYTGNMFPAEYKNNIFVARHGSWNRTKKSGFDVARVSFDAKGKVKSVTPFITGWMSNESFWGRPADVHVMKDGSLLVSDSVAGAIYRVSYSKPMKK